MFDIEKMVQICGYMLRKHDGRLNYIKLIKLLYLADKEALKGSIHTITGDMYVSMKNGPVLSQLYDLVRGKAEDRAAQNIWDCRFTKDGYDLIAVSDRIPVGKLSRFERGILDRIDSQFHDSDIHDLIAYLHRPDICPEWRDPGNAIIPISFRDVLKSVGCSDEETAWIVEENQAFDEEEQIFSRLAEA
jgi:hypothetical protein